MSGRPRIVAIVIGAVSPMEAPLCMRINWRRYPALRTADGLIAVRHIGFTLKDSALLLARLVVLHFVLLSERKCSASQTVLVSRPAPAAFLLGIMGVMTVRLTAAAGHLASLSPIGIRRGFLHVEGNLGVFMGCPRAALTDGVGVLA